MAAIRKASHATAESANATQVDYLAEYLQSLGAHTFVAESHYICRHFIEEVSRYYARCLPDSPNFAARRHFFSEAFDDAALDEMILRAAKDSADAESVNRSLNDSYLGYVTVRPFASVPVGRTVLRARSGDTTSVIRTLVKHTVHVLGFELTISGLAFQQQDRAVAACATTSVWTALQRVARNDGYRVPTPPEITDAAIKWDMPQGRAFPSPGLTVGQMCDALRAFGFAPDLFSAVGRAASAFPWLLQMYLRSGIPVVLAIINPNGGGHALTAIGYRAGGTPHVSADGPWKGVAFKNLEADEIYVHDDRIGPYVPATVSCAQIAVDTQQVIEGVALTIPWSGEQFMISSGAAPLYPKVRLNADELLRSATYLLPVFKAAFGEKDLEVEVFFDRSGSYLAALYGTVARPKLLGQFQRAIALSRYVGIVRCWRSGEILLDTIWDTTDRIREESYREQMLAVVAMASPAAAVADALRDTLNVVAI